MLVELVAQPHCLYLLCTEAINYFILYYSPISLTLPVDLT